jgi:coproporphyrinogen III oxidase-like Fe-S oxidoreductase
VARNGHGLQVEDALTPHERATEALLMGLRLAEGVDLDRIAGLAGGTAPIDRAAARQLEAQGLVTLTDDHLTVTEAGALLLDAILPRIVLDAPVSA